MVFGEQTQVRTVYDVCHNIAKKEFHDVKGVKKELVVHRKGATRAFPAGHEDIPQAYRDVGQPVIIPGSMGTASYVLVGSPKSMELSFGSTAHGAGRVMSRLRAKRDFPAELVKEQLVAANVTIKAASLKGISEEAPGAYKDVDEVIRVSHEAGIARKVARMRPIGVIKG
jgi:tRNA-splicing ligase RtcB